jgi:hypothetical protein
MLVAGGREVGAPLRGPVCRALMLATHPATLAARSGREPLSTLGEQRGRDSNRRSRVFRLIQVGSPFSLCPLGSPGPSPAPQSESSPHEIG